MGLEGSGQVKAMYKGKTVRAWEGIGHKVMKGRTVSPLTGELWVGNVAEGTAPPALTSSSSTSPLATASFLPCSEM